MVTFKKKNTRLKKENKKFFLLYGDFDIIEIKNISNPKSNRSSKKIVRILLQRKNLKLTPHLKNKHSL